MTIKTEVPISGDSFILLLMRLDRGHYQRVEAVRSVTSNDLEYFLFAPNGKLEDIILDPRACSRTGLQSRAAVSFRDMHGTGNYTKCWKAA